MSVETGSTSEAGVPWGAPLAPPRSFLGLGGRRRVLVPGISEVRGPDASMQRDALFRRMLAVADIVALIGAFLLTIVISRRTMQLTWATTSEIPILLVGAKLTGLYDRDETLLRKTTLDEAPKARSSSGCPADCCCAAISDAIRR
jgi:hypothetical protein